MSTVVVNLKKEKYDVYIGRGSKWGNMYVIGIHGTRNEVIELYRVDLLDNDKLLLALPEIYGKSLGCYCKPSHCHGDILAKFADIVHGAIQEAGRKLTAQESRDLLKDVPVYCRFKQTTL